MQCGASFVRRKLVRLSVSLLVLAGFVWPALAEAPNIGLVYTAEQFAEFQPPDDDPLERYTNAIQDNGGTVVVLPQTDDGEPARSRLELLDGVLIPGGIDVDPKFYHETRHENLEKTDAELDALEFAALAYAKERALPVLGICRGHQLLNVYYGGSLIQDIPSEHHSARLVIHRRPKKGAAGQGKPQHPIAISEGSLLRELLGTDAIMVNTYHHQAVKNLAPGFIVTARTQDGIVEAIEAAGPVFILGVQFHPEKMREDEPCFNAIFERFVREAAKAQGRREAAKIPVDEGASVTNE